MSDYVWVDHQAEAMRRGYERSAEAGRRVKQMNREASVVEVAGLPWRRRYTLGRDDRVQADEVWELALAGIDLQVVQLRDNTWTHRYTDQGERHMHNLICGSRDEAMASTRERLRWMVTRRVVEAERELQQLREAALGLGS
jgi:hypothetical protein